MRRCARPASASGSSGRSRWRTWPEAPWCGRRDSNPHSLTRSRFSCRFGFRRRPSLKDRRSWSGLSLRHSVAALGAPRLVSTPSRALARLSFERKARQIKMPERVLIAKVCQLLRNALSPGLGSGLAWAKRPLAFPEFGRFYAADFPAGTPIEVCCVYHFATSAGRLALAPARANRKRRRVAVLWAV
jgi:hypothetical protein